jgi:uncharacterized membrane protein YphA (DoxX/SURF4 family)
LIGWRDNAESYMGGGPGLAALKRLRWDTSIPALAVLLTEAQTAVRFLFAGEYKVPVLPPEFAALLATTFEWSCSTLLALGLATRVATLALLGMVAIIQTFVYPSAWAEHLTWGSILLIPTHARRGAISLDRLFGLEPTHTDKGCQKSPR